MTSEKDRKEAAFLTSEEAEQVTPDLPPAGYKRDEELSRRTDALEEAAESLPERGRIPEKLLKPDREIQKMFEDYNMLEVTNAQDGWVYCWVPTITNGIHISAKKSQGWFVVQGDDPECREKKIREDTTRRIGDVLLMKTTEENYAKIIRHEELKKVKREQAAMADVEMIVSRHPKVFRLRTDLSEVSIGGRNLEEVIQQRSAARGVALKGVNNMLREGRVPGLMKPGK